MWTIGRKHITTYIPRKSFYLCEVNTMDQEIWKDIQGYEGLYQVSNFGNVKSVKRMGTNGGTLAKSYYKIGYEKTLLCKGNKRKTYKTHLLVAQAFIPNPENKPQINHIDGNKQNNCVDNLEWCSAKENMEHAIRTGLRTFDYLCKPIAQIKNGEIIATYKSIQDVKRKYGYNTTNICRTAKGIWKSAYGFQWKYL